MRAYWTSQPVVWNTHPHMDVLFARKRSKPGHSHAQLPTEEIEWGRNVNL
jgi:hypothetical protein